MSNFDDWAKSSAEQGGLLGAWRAKRRKRRELNAMAISRRSLMKRAGLVGVATVWATPLVQSVMTPAWAVQSCTPNCPNLHACTTGGDCSSQNCTLGVCVGAASNANGTSCSTGTQAQQDGSCQSGYCNTTNNTCASPPGNVALNQPCHGNSTSVATANCSSPLVCSGGTGATTPTTNGTCKIPNGTACQGTGNAAKNASCASGNCGAGNVCAV